MVKIFVGGLSSSVTSEDLRGLFEKYGKVNECDVLKNYAFVHMEREAEANKAINELHRHSFKGSSLTVEYATSKIRNATKIYVGNVSSKVTTSDIKALFEKYGRVVECDIVKNYAFVHMARERDAMDAIMNLNDHRLEDQKLFVTLSKSNNATKGIKGGPVTRSPPPSSSYFFSRERIPPPPPPPSYSSRYDRDYLERYAYDLYDRATRSAYDRVLSASPLATEAALSAAASALLPSSYRERSPISRRSLSQYADPYSLSPGYGQSYTSPYSHYSVGAGYSAEDYYERYSNGYASHSY
ncbi:RNA-binding protein 4.1-like [Pleurodeles waltl]|uniref:RNA-binding protein 4.1-like n=1 Tax=Pleurodeles waltl TaxID=8319 RepID=UPI0037096CB3